MTSSETSSELSRPSRPVAPLAVWALAAVAQIGLAFASRGAAGADPDLFYDPTFFVNGIIVYALLVGITAFVASLVGDTVGTLGLRPFRPVWLAWAGGAVVASIVVAAIVEVFLHPSRQQGIVPEEFRSDRLLAFALSASIVVLVAPFAEELFFRGAGIPALARLGTPAAVGVTAIAFSLAHGIPAAVPPLFFFAVLLGLVRLRAASVWPCVVAHSGYNGLALALAFAAPA